MLLPGAAPHDPENSLALGAENRCHVPHALRWPVLTQRMVVRCPVLTKGPRTVLFETTGVPKEKQVRVSAYAMSGIDIALRYAKSGTDIRVPCDVRYCHAVG
eukprot:3109657-Rhodomonas_salina.4